MIATTSRLADRYVLGELLGRGGMGAVYRGVDERLDREVAVKVLPVAEGALGSRLRQEARILARLDHPSLVRVLDADEHEDQPFIVMDLVEGRTLRDRIADGPLDERSVRELARDVLDGLDHAHGHGVVHRDLKPANIVLGDDGRARVVDFGIARLVDATGLTKPGTTVGTAAYLAPEQLGDDADVGPAADVYTLGLVLLEALTGERPFAGDAVETALARLHQPPDIPGHLAEPWPRLLGRMTALQPGARPGAAEVRAALDGEASPVQAGPEETNVQTAAIAQGGPTAVLRAPPSRRRGEGARRAVAALRANAKAVVAAIAAVLLIAGAIVLFAGGDEGGEGAPAQADEVPRGSIPPDLAEAIEHLRETVRP